MINISNKKCTYIFHMTFPEDHFTTVSTRMDFYIDTDYKLYSRFLLSGGGYTHPTENGNLRGYLYDGEIMWSPEDKKEVDKYLIAAELMK